MTVVEIAPQEDFISSIASIRTRNGEEMLVIAEIANPEFRVFNNDNWAIPEGVIYVPHNTAKNSYGDSVDLVNITIDHFHQHSVSFDTSKTTYTGRITAFNAYADGFPEQADLGAGEVYRSIPPLIEALSNIDVIINVDRVRNKTQSDRMVESFETRQKLAKS